MNYGTAHLRQKIEDIAGQDLRQKNRFHTFLLSILTFVTIGLITFGISIGIGAFVEILDNTPALSSIDAVSPSSTKSIVYASDGSIMQELIQSGSNRISVTYDQLPENLIHAFVVIEDRRFFDHDGVDVKGIFRAIFVGVTTGKLSEGASTLTQQLIKNNVFNGCLETNLGDRIERKFQEQSLALKVERELDKSTIITYYLNTINLGSNCLGVQVASRRYFGKDVSELDLSECTVLAAITQNPSKLNPITHPEKNQARRKTILKYMLEDGLITQDEYDEALSEDVYKRIQTVAGTSGSSTQHAFSYFTDVVFEQVLEALQTKLHYTDTQAYNLLYSGGLRIYTTMDPGTQAIVEAEVNDPANYIVTDKNGVTKNYCEYALDYRLTLELKNGELYYYDESNVKKYFQETLGKSVFQLTFASEEELKAAATEYRNFMVSALNATVVSETITSVIEPQTSVVLMDQSTGRVLACVGGRGDKDEIGSLVLNRATDSTRQPGSCFKILSTYAPAIDLEGATLGTTYYDSALYIGEKSISNWWGSTYLGYANIREAIMASMNIVAVRCLDNTVGVTTGYNYAQNLGISTLVSQDMSPIMALGGLTYGVTNLEMTAAYASIANQGVYNEPIFWTHVTDASGNLILENSQKTSTVMKSDSALLLTSAMESSVNQPFVLWPDQEVSATSVECAVEGMGIAGKSGTTTDANDLWFVGYSPYYTLGIWSGYDSSISFGVSPGYHRIIWQKIMAKVHDGLESASFDYSSLETAKICSKCGLLAKEGICDASGDNSCHVYEEYYAPGTAPLDYCTCHTSYRVCTESGALANEYCPEDSVETRVYITVSPKDNDGTVTVDSAYTLPAELSGNYCTVHHEPEPETTEPPTFTDESSEGEASPGDESPEAPDDGPEDGPDEETAETVVEGGEIGE